MLRTVVPDTVRLDARYALPAELAPLVSAFASRADLRDAIVSIVHDLGFENFLYGASASPRLDQESRSYVFTTLPREWVERYDREAYIEIDPRLARALDSALPLVWDYESEHGRNARVDAFLDDSLAHGVGSGVVVGLHGPRGVRVIVALSSAHRTITPQRRQAIVERLGNVVLLAIHFHEIFMRTIVEQGVAPASQGAPLSPRELECLELAARGQTTRDMALKLGITERTIQFHFDSIRSKLGAMNRQGATARAIADGLISIGGRFL